MIETRTISTNIWRWWTRCLKNWIWLWAIKIWILNHVQILSLNRWCIWDRFITHIGSILPIINLAITAKQTASWLTHITLTKIISGARNIRNIIPVKNWWFMGWRRHCLWCIPNEPLSRHHCWMQKMPDRRWRIITRSPQGRIIISRFWGNNSHAAKCSPVELVMVVCKEPPAPVVTLSTRSDNTLTLETNWLWSDARLSILASSPSSTAVNCNWIEVAKFVILLCVIFCIFFSLKSRSSLVAILPSKRSNLALDSFLEFCIACMMDANEILPEVGKVFSKASESFDAELPLHVTSSAWDTELTTDDCETEGFSGANHNQRPLATKSNVMVTSFCSNLGQGFPEYSDSRKNLRPSILVIEKCEKCKSRCWTKCSGNCIIVWRQCAPLAQLLQSILSSSDAIGKFSTQQNFQGHQWQRTKYDSAQKKSHSLSQAKTSELPPAAEYHFVIRAHYKARGGGGGGGMSRTCGGSVLTLPEA